MNDQLTETLQLLHQQLENLDPLNDNDRQQLRQAVVEIQESLNQGEVDSANLARDLHAKTEGFADSHPTLTRLAGQVADLLGQMGI